MTQGIFADLREFIVSGLWGEEENDDACQEECGARNYSVFQGESVCDPSYLRDRNVSVFQGESVCDSAYSCRGESSVFQGESLCEPSFADRRVAGATVCFKRPDNGRERGPYQAREEDPLDVAIAEYFRLNPQAYSNSRGFARIKPGHYLLHGREIVVDFDKTDSFRNLMGEQGYLVVKDGPLKQPLDDYLMNKEATAEYSGSVFQVRNALQSIPQDCRMTFHDTGAGYSRIEAMKVAKEQANTREKAAALTKQGQLPGCESQGKLVAVYEKTIDRKLGKNVRTEQATFATISAPASSFPTAFASPASHLVTVRPPQGQQRSPYLAGGA